MKRAGDHGVGLTLANRLASLFAVAIITVGCGSETSGGQPSPSPVFELGTITLSDTGCVYQGATNFSTGTVLLHTANQTANSLAVGMLLLHTGHEYAELATHIADEQTRIRAGQDPIGPPTYVFQIFQELVSPNSTLTVTKLVDVAGTYGLVCGRVKGETSLGIWVFGPLTVTS